MSDYIKIEPNYKQTADYLRSVIIEDVKANRKQAVREMLTSLIEIEVYLKVRELKNK